MAEAIVQQFGTFDNMKAQLSAATTAVQGSGWGWLGYNKPLHKLQIATCANQDPLEATTGEYSLNKIPNFLGSFDGKLDPKQS